jgi:hypothetical protein
VTEELHPDRLVWTARAGEADYTAFATNALEAGGNVAEASGPSEVFEALAELVELASHGNALTVPDDGSIFLRTRAGTSGCTSQPSPTHRGASNERRPNGQQRAHDEAGNREGAAGESEAAHPPRDLRQGFAAHEPQDEDAGPGLLFVFYFDNKRQDGLVARVAKGTFRLNPDRKTAPRTGRARACPSPQPQ